MHLPWASIAFRQKLPHNRIFPILFETEVTLTSMSEPKFLTAPLPSTHMPKGIPYIVGNEAAERFSFYGMKAILFVFMTKYLVDATGADAFMSSAEARTNVHLFVFFTYFFPILGAIISDAFFGKYRTILALSIVYCLGHFALALDETRLGLLVGLGLIAVGSGGIKPCVSAHVGDQFGKSNQHLLSKVFSGFYFAINLGAFVSTMLTPILLDEYGPAVAFGVPGVLMFIATVMFWMGRHEFIHIPAGGMKTVREAFSGDGIQAIKHLGLLYLFVAVFWSLFDQTASAWVEQATKMDLTFMGRTWKPSQIQAANPVMILAFIPLFSYVVYPWINKFFPLTPLRKVSIGFFITAVAFSISAWIEMQITAGGTPNIIWQILAYAVLTSAEIMVSITCLEFSYTQSPKTMKSFIMSLYLLSVAVGNGFTAGVNYFIQNEDGTSKLAGASYYWFFTGLMFVTAVLFIFVAKTYKGKTYIHEEEELTDEIKSEAAAEFEA